ncbi:PAS domain-containing sensor histidine kinase [Natronoarchaeum mannanilyticum]
MLDGIFESVPVHIYVKDAAGRHRKVSDFLERSDELVGKRDADLEFVDEEHGRQATEADMRVIETGEPILDEEEYLPEIDHWNLSSKVPLHDASGDVTGLIGVTRRITERKRAQQELERKTERLEDFADVVSHDIRNPLSVARGYVDLARGAEDREEYLEEVADSLDRADAIVDDVLALSRHDRIELDEEVVSLTGVARSAWRSVTTASATLELPDEDVDLIADRSQLSRLLENLFRNSVEHGGDGVTIAVEATADGFAVEDDGPGIPPEKREKVFEMAYTTEESGSGLGLGIVAEVADAHGWSVEAVEGTGEVVEGERGGAERPTGSRSSDDGRGSSSGARFEITGVRRSGEEDS